MAADDPAIADWAADCPAIVVKAVPLDRNVFMPIVEAAMEAMAVALLDRAVVNVEEPDIIDIAVLDSQTAPIATEELYMDEAEADDSMEVITEEESLTDVIAVAEAKTLANVPNPFSVTFVVPPPITTRVSSPLPTE